MILRTVLRRTLVGTISSLAMAAAAGAQMTAPGITAVSTSVPDIADAGLGDIVVTAQKRSQSINKVGMSIVAATGEQLLTRGISDTADLVKIVPGFSATQTGYATPVYTLRGVGLYDSGLASSPAVSVYVDQVALPFPQMTTGATVDLERVEVLKGPQGTLFGQNSTGGAINYIAAKPTADLTAGGSLTIERFGKFDATGYVSGPLSDTVRARLAIRGVEGGDWQYSAARPGDENGKSRLLVGRLLIDWNASDALDVTLNLNGFLDRSDTQQPQLTANLLNVRGAADPRNPFAVADPVRFARLTNPASPGYDAGLLGRQALVLARFNGSEGAAVATGAGLYLGEPVVGNKARAANWSPNFDIGQDKSFGQASVRLDYELSNAITLTSITAGEYLDLRTLTDLDATSAQAIDSIEFGTVKGFNQELRLASTSSQLNWIIGANYDYQQTSDTISPLIGDLSQNEIGPNKATGYDSSLNDRINTYALFGNVEYRLTHAVSVQAAARYTNSRQKASSCTSDRTATQGFANGFLFLQQVFTAIGVKRSPIVPVGPGQCFAFDASFTPTLTPVDVRLNEDNISWRFGLTNTFDSGALVYANVSRGYKSGIFSPVPASAISQYAPARQERVDAFETGFKLPMLSRRVQLNAAAFYYDYADKQLRSKLIDPIFGALELLINVPKSRVWGLESEFIVEPVTGLHVSASGTYLNSRIRDTGTSFFNQPGFFGNFAGSKIPFTPTFTGVADAEYDWAVGSGLRGFVGTSVTYHSSEIATFRTAALPADDYQTPAYTQVDVRAGFGAADGDWKVQFFGRNVTNKYYFTGTFQGVDTVFRYAGRPATYGIIVSGQFR